MSSPNILRPGVGVAIVRWVNSTWWVERWATYAPAYPFYSDPVGVVAMSPHSTGIISG